MDLSKLSDVVKNDVVKKVGYDKLVEEVNDIDTSGFVLKTKYDTDKTELKKEINKSHIFKDLHSTATCFDSYNSLCFKIIDKANSKFELKIKEALHINWRKPNLNAQQNDLALTLSL